MKTQKFLKPIASAFTVAAITLAGISPAQAEVTSNLSIDVDLLVFVPCANGGAGELVELTGSLHVLLTFTQNAAGGFNAKSHFQPQGIHGVGLTTGLSYNATGETQETFSVAAGVQDTFVNNFKIIGQGPNNNYLVHENLHITINANGIATASVDNLSVDCH